MKPGLKLFPPPWEGHLLLACRKCQKKLKKSAAHPELARLKKAVKRRNRSHPSAPLHVLDVPCMKVCPKDAVTVCDPRQEPLRLGVLRSKAELDRFYPET